jgi:hypothetical protein
MVAVQRREHVLSYHPSLTLSQTPHGGFLVECDRFPPLTYATLGEAQAFIKGYFKQETEK